jgi:A/G-specific adenine glycosylase
MLSSVAAIDPNPTQAKQLRARLLAWFAQERRALPWRENQDPYRVWISEAMLQQTRVETVLGYFDRFLTRFPRIEDLAGSEEDDVLALWSGLGYYSRARKLREAAIAVVADHDGEFPRTRAAALALPGVGPYTAGAVLSIAYDLPEPLVDGNVQRVFARLFAFRDVAGSGTLQKKLWALAEDLVPENGGAGDWNQALMELGATVCTPRDPDCGSCPVASLCRAKELELVHELPVPAPRKKPTEVALDIYVAERGADLLLEKRPPKGRMAGLWQFPTLERAPGSALFPSEFEGGDVILKPGGVQGELRHSITRYRIRAEIRSAELEGTPPPSWRWFTTEELGDVALTGMARKVLVQRENAKSLRVSSPRK